MNQKKSASILKKFLLFNLLVFSVLGLFTYIYLQAIQPNLVKNKSTNHLAVIKNTTDHLQRLDIEFDEKGLSTFLLSARFLFQSLDRVQFFNLDGNLIGDTDMLDLDQTVFSRSELIIEESINSTNPNKIRNNTNNNINNSLEYYKEIKKIILGKFKDEPLVIENKIKKDFFVQTLNKVLINEKQVGYILVGEQSNEILVAVEERKDFIIRTVLVLALAILIFSVFLNKYILKPISFLVKYTESIKAKSDRPLNIDNFFIRRDEVGKLTQSIHEMTLDLQKRTNRAETFSIDLAHEIRNPLASLKGASELLDKTTEQKDREKLLSIIDHDVERIERLITDYTQMLKDEASLSREKMVKIDIYAIIKNVVDDFMQDIVSLNKKIEIEITNKKDNKKNFYILGIENRIEQVIANLLDNSISFSQVNNKISIELDEIKNKFLITFKDQGPGFKEKNIENIFKRFYSNRPKNFGEHSGLGLNIVKNITELHKGKIQALNRQDVKGAQIELTFPKHS
ncbi:MAG: HAMP domain-containing histidine kinase [Pelagibacteraceae bacterium]|jgi:two-component system, OmpR family, sensor histidine kinase ChvG|nr:HAMP domain-containing histidine kinase [Pelagibacteraceae bacterium]